MSRLRGDRDGGVALVTVLVLGFVMMLLVSTGLTAAVSGLMQAVSVQRGTSALDAAFAGVQDYLARVNVDSTYTQYGNPASAFSATSSVVLPPITNPAFGTGTSGTWATVPGSAIGSGANPAKFRYEVDTSKYVASGIVRLRSTGLSGGRTTSILASLRVRGFIDYAYFTDYEIQDPQISGAPATCVKHAWEGRPRNCGGVQDIQFGATDKVYGDVHSNDTMRICGSTFVGNATTSNTTTPLYVVPAGCSTPTVTMTYSSALPMPSTNTAMKQTAGCLYTGPTQVTYHADGTMTVVSPWTRSTGGSASVCGDPAALDSAAGATVRQLASDLLYVQNVPSVTSDANYWSTTAKPAGLSCIGSDGTTTSAATGIGWSIGSVRYPLANEAPATGWANSADPTQWSTATPAYGCRNGDLYTKGTVAKLTTAASENYVYITGDLQYADKTKDVFGLVGQNGVLVWNPMDRTNDQPMLSDANGDTLGKTFFGREVDAAMVSVAHTFQVQNFDQGATRGVLHVYGSIAQKFRGPVGTTDPDTGYVKSYEYDPLLKVTSPPKFLEPSATSYAVTNYASVPPAYAATGAVLP